MGLNNCSDSEDPNPKRKRSEEKETRNQEVSDKNEDEIEDENFSAASGKEEKTTKEEEDEKLAVEYEIRNSEDEEKLDMRNDSVEDDFFLEDEEKDDYSEEQRGLLSSDSENEEKNIFKRKAERELELMYASQKEIPEPETEYEEEEDEEEEEEEADWKKGKTKEEQVKMLIDSFQNKDLFKSDADDLSEDEDGFHEMTCEEFVKYNLELRDSGGFEIEYYPKVFSCGMIKPYYDPPRMELKPNELDDLISFAQKAIDKYNNKNNTNYGQVRVLKANSVVVSGMMYYITVRASNDAGVRTFQTMVLEGIPKCGVPRIKVRLVRRLRMHK